jgi:hypothetical protein
VGSPCRLVVEANEHGFLVVKDVLPANDDGD